MTFYAETVCAFIFVDPVKRVIRLSHSGWRGTVHKMAITTVRKMQETFGCDQWISRSVVGPSTLSEVLKLAEDVIDEFRANYKETDWDSLFCIAKRMERYQLDLWRANGSICWMQVVKLRTYGGDELLCVPGYCNHSAVILTSLYQRKKR